MKVAALSGVEPPLYGGALVRAVVVLPVKVLSRVFRGKFLAGLKCLYRGKKLQCVGPSTALADPRQFAQLIRRLHRQDCHLGPSARESL